MFPMIAEVDEFTAARAHCRYRGRARPAERQMPVPEPLRVGAMLEVPSLIWQLPALLAEADFVSVGSNDLLQFLFASDRGNPRLADRYDPLSPPPAARCSAKWRGRCAAAGRRLSVCGEMARQAARGHGAAGPGHPGASRCPPRPSAR